MNVAQAKPQQAGRREQILEVATHLFQKGFRATSLDHVAAELGVTRPALYYYFRSKEELLAAIYDRAVGVLIDRAAVLFSQKLAPDVLLRRLIEVHVRTMLQEHPIVRVYFQEKDSLGEGASRSVKSKEVAFTKMMASTIKAGQKKGLFRPGSAELIVNAILGMLIWVYQWYRPERHHEDDISEVFWQLLAGGLVVGQSVDAPRAGKSGSTVRRKGVRSATARPALRVVKS
jgi:AcrR family transcriptional regulator